MMTDMVAAMQKFINAIFIRDHSKYDPVMPSCGSRGAHRHQRATFLASSLCRYHRGIRYVKRTINRLCQQAVPQYSTCVLLNSKALCYIIPFWTMRQKIAKQHDWLKRNDWKMCYTNITYSSVSNISHFALWRYYLNQMTCLKLSIKIMMGPYPFLSYAAYEIWSALISTLGLCASHHKTPMIWQQMWMKPGVFL